MEPSQATQDTQEIRDAIAAINRENARPIAKSATDIDLTQTVYDAGSDRT